MSGPAVVTRVDFDRTLHISYSQLKTYLLCPMKYQHRYLLNTEPSHRSVNLVFGGAIHHALAKFYVEMSTSRKKMPLERFQQTFRDRWQEEQEKPLPISFNKKADAGAMLDLGIGLLNVFCEQATVIPVLAVESPFLVDLYDLQTGDLQDVKLAGVFDLIIEEAGRPMVVEHKTAARRYSQDQLTNDLQPSIYRYAAEQLGIADPGLRYQLFLKTKVPAIEQYDVTRSETQLIEMLETVAQIQNATTSGAFYRQRGWTCADCEYSYNC